MNSAQFSLLVRDHNPSRNRACEPELQVALTAESARGALPVCLLRALPLCPLTVLRFRVDQRSETLSAHPSPSRKDSQNEQASKISDSASCGGESKVMVDLTNVILPLIISGYLKRTERVDYFDYHSNFSRFVTEE
jgi:hypothetical protein